MAIDSLVHILLIVFTFLLQVDVYILVSDTIF